VSDPTQGHPTVFLHFGYGALTHFGRPFQGRSSMQKQSDIGALQPPTNKTVGFGLFPFRSPLLWESLLISFPLLLRCFSCQSNLPVPYGSGSSPITEMEFPHSEIPGYSACLAAYRGLSQLATSFFGVQSRGIHVMRMSNVFSCPEVMQSMCFGASYHTVRACARLRD